MAKRGRKPSTNKIYFGEEQEKAVLDYLTETDLRKKEKIYNEHLKTAFETMIESIIRRYKLFVPDEDYEDTFHDTLSHLMTKANKFNQTKYKAYSYYGTICKNYLLGRLSKYKTTMERYPLYDKVPEEIGESIKTLSENDRGVKIASATLAASIKRIKKMCSDENSGLRENERKLGNALIMLLENWDYVLTTDSSNKLNKNAILLYLRETTGLDTKGIRDNMKKFKNEYWTIKETILQNE